MSKKGKISKPIGGHTSISNKPEQSLRAEQTEFFVGNPVSEEPSEGLDPKTKKAKDDGTEDVPGHKKTSMEPIITAPDTSKFRDIGEASFGAFQETVQVF